jgi:hypothetical protein
MSRKRVLPAEESFARHSLRIVRALKTGELDPLGYLILKFLVDEIEPPGSGGEAIHKLKELEELLDWPRSGEWLRQKLHALRASGWIDFDEPRRVRDAAWIFRLTGAAIDGKSSPLPSDLQLRTPSELEVTSNNAQGEEPLNPQPESGSQPLEPPTAEIPREEKRREERTRSEEKLDHVVVKTTAADPERGFTDRLIAKVEAHGRRRRRSGPGPGDEGFGDFIRGAYRSGLINRAEWLDRVALHGFLLRSGPPDEPGVLGAFQSFDAGLGEWAEDDRRGTV